MIDLIRCYVFRTVEPNRRNPIDDDVVKLTQQLPYDYDTVFDMWYNCGRDVEAFKKLYGFEILE